MSRAGPIVLVAAGALALLVPLIARRALERELRDRVEPSLSEALGARVDIGGVEASLTGAIRLTDVAVGDLIEADAVEASVGLRGLLAGRLGADEIRVDRPRLRVRVDEQGRSGLQELMARAQARRGGAGGGAPGPGRLRRILVSGGEVELRLG